MKTIGKYYEVTDNSYNINLDTSEWTALVQRKDGWYSPDPKKDGAEFIIISKPFLCEVEELYNYEFIIVKSTKTGTCYRVLYNRSNIYQKVCKREYLFNR